MDTDDMDSCGVGQQQKKKKRKSGRTRGSCEEDGGADGFEEVEFLAGL